MTDEIPTQICAKKKRGRPRSDSSVRAMFGYLSGGNTGLRTVQRRMTATRRLMRAQDGARFDAVIMAGRQRLSATFLERLSRMPPEWRGIVFDSLERGWSARDAEDRLVFIQLESA